jgi:hypothetical protein
MKIGYCFQIVFPTFMSFTYFVMRLPVNANTQFKL